MLKRTLNLALLVILASLPAFASPITFQLNQPDAGFASNPCCVSGTNFGTVFADLNGTTLSVTVQMSPGFTIKLLDGSDFGFNVAGTNLNVSNIFGSSNVDGSNAFALTATLGSGNVSSFGTFNTILFHLDPNLKNAPSGISYLTFTVSGVTSLDQAVFFAHLVSDTGLTGYVETGSTVVPEPASLALLGSGMISAGMWLRRRRKIA